MPRNADATRAKLLAVGRAQFAERGVYATPLKSIVESAGQRNTSALHYHFGGRDGLLSAIITEFNLPIEIARAEALDELERNTAVSVETLVDAWIDPWVAHLHTEPGRQFLMIISQLGAMFDDWGVPPDETGPYAIPQTPTQALRCMELIGEHLVQLDDDAIRRERLSRFLEMTADALGSRARRIGAGKAPTLDHSRWLANLKAMTIAALRAPSVGE